MIDLHGSDVEAQRGHGRRERVFATNLNLHTTPVASPMENEVLSWGWVQRGQTSGDVAASLQEQGRSALRRFVDGDDRADTYLRGKRLFLRSPGGILHALAWVMANGVTADRVVIKRPAADVDGLLTVAALVAGRLGRTPVWLYSETWLLPTGRRQWCRRTAYILAARGAGHVLVPSALHRRFHRALGVPVVRVIPSVYCPSPAESSIGLTSRPRKPSKREFRLLYVGRLVSFKGPDRLAAVVPEVLRRGFAVTLTVVVGRLGQYPGPDPRYPDRCLAQLRAAIPPPLLNVVEEVDDIDEVYRAATLLIAPGRVVPGDRVPAEAWSRAVEEAVLNGLPVVATDAVPAAVELIRHSKVGYVVPSGSDRALTDAICWTLSRANSERS